MRRLTALRWCGTLLASSYGLSGCGDPSAFQTLARPAPSVIDTTEIDAAPNYLRTFSAGDVDTEKLTLDSGFKLITHDFSLLQLPRSEDILHQIERPIQEDVYLQGNSGISNKQDFAISEAGLFDLLIVMDNSSSMGPYQTRLGKTLPNILKHITNTNWQIAVVNTSSACLRKSPSGAKTLTRAEYDKDPVAGELAFKAMIAVGENGDSVERGVLRATQAMTGEGCPKESNLWLRPDSERAVLMVTDENNCGSAPNEGCKGETYELANYFLSRVGTKVTVNGLLLLQDPPAANPSDPSDPNHDCENSGGYLDAPNPKEYLTMVNTTGGIFSDICRSNYSNILEQISLKVKEKINIQFELDYAAVADSLEVSMDGKPVQQFSVSGKTLSILEPVAGDKQKISVRYKHSPVPMKKSFTPHLTADAKTVEVYVNGDRVPSTKASYSSTTGALELADLPPENAEIKMRYRANSALPTQFSVSPSSVKDSLKVMVDGIEVQGFQVDAAQHKIVLREAPRDGQTVRISYERPGDKTLEYAVSGTTADNIESIEVVDATTGEALEAALQAGKLVFPSEAIAPGRKVRAHYNLNYAFQDKTFKLKLDKIPFPDTVKVEAGGSGEVCNKNLEVLPSQISFQCKDEDFESIQVSYQHVENYRNSFPLNIDYSGPRTVRVFVNQKEIQDFHEIGDQIVILRKNLPAGAEVQLLVSPK